MKAMVAQIAQLPPAQAIAELKKLFASDAKMVEMLTAMESMPPDEQQQMLGQILGGGNASV